ncbi:hypothetical protein JCM3766R1_006403 [Sporobolomyces carnicolor]
MTSFLLPVELWHAVFERLVDDSCALARACLTSRSFLSITQPIMYRQIRMATRLQSGLGRFEVGCSRHLDAFDANPGLRPLVRSLHLVSGTPSLGGLLHRRPWRGVEVSEAMEQLFEKLPLLEVVSVEKVSYWRALDDAIGRYQSSFNPPRARQHRQIGFRLELPGFDVDQKRTCKGAYEEVAFHTKDPPPAVKIIPATFLSQSLRTLRVLSISLRDDLDLSPFRFLESLSLRLRVSMGRSVIPTLVRVVPAIESLKSLRLRGSLFCYDLTDLVHRGRIVDCLGPNVVSVSMEYYVPLEDLEDLARSIPLPRESCPMSLKRFNSLPPSAIGGDDLAEDYKKKRVSVMDDFRKRGIELRFDDLRAE